ncbi:metallophosphoesterase family protein [Asticcacaulis sp. AC460]|uniref:metallophosphoesterase family protein n=1 Tax=Asticcacaulis sp. AC460 TaxID=1282360 RepID=UPI00041C400C|nr:DNA repair exonuclease [Asticcacaulis sp. AC460]
MRFIHTSDWQLGKPFGRAPEEARSALQDARLDVIDTLAKAAQSNDAKVVLVAGDVFDSPEPGDRVYRQALTRMKAAERVKWVLLPGNHDPARSDGLWSRLKNDAPENLLTALEPTPFEVLDGLWVLPAPLLYKRTIDDPTTWFDSGETPERAFRIGLAHGPVVEFSSTQTANNLIAVDRAKTAKLSYLALGDWHGRRQIDAYTHYCGTPEPDDFGREVTGMALLVDVSQKEAPDVVEIPTGRYFWRSETWDLRSGADLLRELNGFAPEVDRRNLVARLKLSGLVSLSDRAEVRNVLENEFAHEIRWLDLQAGDLFVRPTDDDMADIDLNGVLREVAERLSSMAAADGMVGRRAASALERLYIEQQKLQRRGVSE